MNYSNKRGEDETFEQYKDRQKFLTKLKKRSKKGISVWDSKSESTYIKDTAAPDLLKERGKEAKERINVQLSNFEQWQQIDAENIEDFLKESENDTEL
jgi:hypothetical protein